jgi:AmiR/NasT family two-component response regulator
VSDRGPTETDADRIKRLERDAAVHAGALDQMRTAADHRDMIGMAKGLVMANLGCTPDAAFDVLVRQSKYEHRKLLVIAGEIVDGAARRGQPSSS